MPEAKANLTDLIATVGGSTRRKPVHPELAPIPENKSRLLGRHVPEEVYRLFHTIRSEQGRTAEALYAEALNDLFAKYGKPEVCPSEGIRKKGRKGQE